MGRMYTVSFTNVAVTAAQDFFQIEGLAGDTILHACFISQNTDVGDAAAENLTIRFRHVTDALTNVTAEVKLDQGSAAALADLNVNDTTALVTGAETIHVEDWNIAMPFAWIPTPEMRIHVPKDDVVTVNLVTTPADSLTVSGTLYFEEIG